MKVLYYPHQKIMSQKVVIGPNETFRELRTSLLLTGITVVAVEATPLIDMNF